MAVPASHQYPGAPGVAIVRSVNASPPPRKEPDQIESLISSSIFEVPSHARAIIVFVHGDECGYSSPRNRFVARSLLRQGFAVLLPQLVDGDDEEDGPASNVGCDGILRKAEMLKRIIDWLARHPGTGNLRIGLFGGRDGAAAAMIAAAARPDRVHAIVSRGGRPDLAEDWLHDVVAPTLMIVGSKDRTHLDHNRKACQRMRIRPMLEVIDGANHLFGEPGKLDQVASISSVWFHRNLALCG